MTGLDKTRNLRRAVATLVLGSAAVGAAFSWQGYGRPLCREAWQGISDLLALGPGEAATLIAVLLGG